MRRADLEPHGCGQTRLAVRQIHVDRFASSCVGCSSIASTKDFRVLNRERREEKRPARGLWPVSILKLGFGLGLLLTAAWFSTARASAQASGAAAGGDKNGAENVPGSLAA